MFVELSEVVLVAVEVVEWVVWVEVLCVLVLCEVVVWVLVEVGVVVLVEVEVEVEVLGGSPEVVDSVPGVVGSSFWATSTEAERVARASR